MQIHELNNKKPAKISEQQVNEVDLVGPGSVWNVGRELGKQVVKDPRALINPVAIGQAKQNAAAASAASSAAELAKPGFFRGKLQGNQPYQVGGAQVTPQQQYQTVKQNAGVQQMIKNLAAQWKAQGVATAAKIKQNQLQTTATVESVRISNLATKDPEEQKLLTAIQKQELDKQIAQLKGEREKTQEKIKANQKILADINAYSLAFQQWANTKLTNLGVNMKEVESNSWAKPQLEEIVKSIGSWGLINPENPESMAKVEEYFNIVLATYQATHQGQPGRASAGTARGAAAPAGEEERNDAEFLQQLGLTVRQDFLTGLNTAMRRAGAGAAIKHTGNEALDALARLAGFQVG